MAGIFCARGLLRQRARRTDDGTWKGRPPEREEAAEIPENTGGGRRHLKYHKSFKVSKTYRRNLSGALSKRVYNASRHGWFVESGRVVASGYKKKNGYKNAPTSGRSKHYYVYRGVEKVFTPVFNNDCIKFAEEMLRR